MDARYYETTETDRLRCSLCPHRCLIVPGKTGICGVRMNEGGTLVLPYAGRLSAVSIDPIEKKPLYHFHPGTEILSVGFVGCSFRCPFCQNYRISQGTGAETLRMTPQELTSYALGHGSFAVAYTYSEPTIHLEYVTETALLAREAGLRNVLVSNGFLNPEPARELLSLMDAANIDLKSFSAEFYRRELGGKLESVLEFLEPASELTHLEVTTLVIPGKNDSEAELDAIASFIASLSPDIPLHLSAYYPVYNYREPPTPPATLERLAELCRTHLRYVYLGNVGGEADTHCASCGAILVRRSGYSVTTPGFTHGRCNSCGARVPIVSE